MDIERQLKQYININNYHLMMRLVSSRMCFSVKNKTQNFFDMNPIYPDFG